ncbi:MAG: iron chelate uptake ABC transporter family permease subunit [Chloroflexi bacterium]|nr:iron chelate uptake ABC transporter family permease subunit [Chloroflexota bacterium]
MLRGRHRRWAIVGLATTLLVLIVLTAAVGSARISVATVYQVLLHRLPFMSAAPAWTASAETIVIDIRLPRIVMAAVVGASLALAGATYQGLFRNPLADPYLIGVSQGAALGAVLGFLLPTAVSPVGMGLVPLTAFTGALLAATAVYLLAKVGKTLPMTTLILAGVAVGAFFSSVTSYLLIASSDKFRGIITWLVGGFYMSNWSEVMVLLPYAAIGTAVILLYSRPLNVMQLDEEQAQQLGINVERVKLILLAAATLITAAAVSFAGTIGFVGILVPHAVRLIWGPDHRSLMPLSALCGAIFMVLTDALVRGLGMLSSNLTEIPVGVVTAFLGAPFFLYLLRQRKRAVF